MGYHSLGDLTALGESIRKHAIRVAAEEAALRTDDIHNRGLARATATKAATREFQDIPGLFGSFYLPNPASWQGMTQGLTNIAATFKHIPLPDGTRNGTTIPKYLVSTYEPMVSADELLREISGNTDNWIGSACKAFHTNFLDVLPGALYNQGWLAAALSITMECAQCYRAGINHDIWAIGKCTLNVLDQLAGTCPGMADAGATLTLFGALLSMVASDGMTLPVAVTAGSAILGAVKQGNNDATEVYESSSSNSDGKKVTITGSDAASTITSMRSAIDDLTTEFSKRDRSLVRALRAIRGYVDERQNKFCPAAPESVTKLEGKSRDAMRDKFFPHT